MSSLHNLDNKPSSRVLAAPGGKSSNIFGTDSSGDARPGRRLDPNASKTSNIFDDSSNYSRPSRGTRSEVSEALNVSSPRGPAGLDDSKSPKKPSVRVHAPPGGQTSNIFGSNSDNSQSRGGRARVGNNDPNASSMGGFHEVSNTGNVDARPSSRVTHAPGGGSSNIFGSDAPVQKGGRARVGNNDSNQSSLGHEQVSSTSNIDAKPSSRVLSAPGGASSNIFGTDAPVERKGRAKVGSNDANSTSIEFGASDAKPSSRVSQAPGGKSSNIFSSDAPVERRGRAKVGGNDANAQSSTDLSVSERPVSRTNLSSNDGPSASSESAGPEARKAHVKVHAPPGGKSSNIFGTD